jgi:hypothetical protein
MRLRICGVSVFLGTVVALVATVALALPRDADRDRGARHSAVRFTRGAVQRLDSTESPAHVAEDPEAVLILASDGVGDFAGAAPPGDGGRLAVATLATPPRLVRDAGPAVRVVSPSDVRPRSRFTRPVLGRAPPAL